MKNIIAIFFVFGLILISQEVAAQCSMCKAVVAGSEDEVIEGVNNGILYMMGVPYLLMMVVGFTWYKKYYKPEKE